MFIRLHSLRLQIAIRIISVTLLISLCAAVAPSQVGPRSVPSSDSTAPFPCQHHACGCQTGEQCWKNCCCFTNAQKMVWAKNNCVKPPEDVLVTATLESEHRCCYPSGCSRKSNVSASRRPKSRQPFFEIGVLADTCHGYDWKWSFSPWSIIVGVMDILRIQTHSGERVVLHSILSPDRSLEPPVPPPRLEFSHSCMG